MCHGICRTPSPASRSVFAGPDPCPVIPLDEPTGVGGSQADQPNPCEIRPHLFSLEYLCKKEEANSFIYVKQDRNQTQMFITWDRKEDRK